MQKKPSKVAALTTLPQARNYAAHLERKVAKLQAAGK